MLLAAGADASLQDADDSTPLHLAAVGKSQQFLDCARLLAGAAPQSLRIFDKAKNVPVNVTNISREMKKVIQDGAHAAHKARRAADGRGLPRIAADPTQE